MARIIGVEVPPNKRIDIALRYIYGIGPVNALDQALPAGGHRVRRPPGEGDPTGPGDGRDHRQVDLHAGQVDTFVFAKDTTIYDVTDYFSAANLFDPQLNQAIRKQNTVARLHLQRFGHYCDDVSCEIVCP